MDPGAADAPGGSGDPPSPSPSSAAAAAGKEEELPLKKSDQDTSEQTSRSAQQAQPAAPAAAAAATTSSSSQQPPSRYESQKRRDWNTFLQYLKNQKPPLTLPRCGGADVIDFLKYLDQFGKTKVHAPDCPHFGHPPPPPPGACPLRQAWGSLDALIGRLRAAYEESGGKPEANPFGAKAVRVYLREVRESQAKARGIPYEKKKRKRLQTADATTSTVEEGPSSTASGAVDSKTIEAEGSHAPQPGAAGGDTKTASGAVDSKTKEAEGSSAPQPGAAGGDTKTASGAEGSKTKAAEGSNAPQPGAAGGDTKTTTTTTTTTTSSC